MMMAAGKRSSNPFLSFATIPNGTSKISDSGTRRMQQCWLPFVVFPSFWLNRFSRLFVVVVVAATRNESGRKLGIRWFKLCVQQQSSSSTAWLRKKHSIGRRRKSLKRTAKRTKFLRSPPLHGSEGAVHPCVLGIYLWERYWFFIHSFIHSFCSSPGKDPLFFVVVVVVFGKRSFSFENSRETSAPFPPCRLRLCCLGNEKCKTL